MSNPFGPSEALAEIEEPSWEFDLGITTRDTDDQQEAAFRRLKPLLVGGLLILMLLVGRLVHLQIVRGEEYRTMALGNSIRTREVAAPRGLIQDREGNFIVKNVASFSLDVIPAYLPRNPAERDDILRRVAQVAGTELPPVLFEEGHRTLEPVTVKDNLAYEEALTLEFALGNLSGVAVTSRPRREYQDLEGIAQLVGYVGKISREELAAARARNDQRYGYTSIVGKSGLEVAYEEYLKGTDGKEQVEVDARGRQIRQLASLPPRPGHNLTLYLDSTVQRTLSASLAHHIQRVGSRAGAAVAVDPKTGGILGMASFPTFRPELFSSGGSAEVERLLSDPGRPLVNRAIAGRYPPGSTIKPLWAAAALEEGTITRRTTVNSVGGFAIGQFIFPDWKPGGHGVTDVKKAIAESVNTFFYAVAGGFGGIPGLGVERLKSYALRFGLTAETGIDLPGEEAGFFPDPEWKRQTRNEGWFLGNTYQLGIGQGDVVVTPLGMLMALTSLTNGGELLRPHVVRQITTPEGTVVREFGKEVIRSGLINPEHLQTVKEGMRQTVTEGSGRSLLDLPVEAAGKTGTAQFAKHRTHAWFFGFAPWQDPQIALIVIVEGGGEGHAAAAPVAKEVLRAYFAP